MNKKLIVANWKSHPDSLAEAREILESANGYLETLGESRELSLVFCPPAVFTEEASKFLGMSHFEHEAFLGAQDISTDDKTTLTGEITGIMLKKLGVRYVIVGHSERRWKLGEDDNIVNQKLKTALLNEITPIVCIGERVRDDAFKSVLEDQCSKTFKGISADEIGRCVIAYEPVWAISTNPGARPDTPESALESVGVIRDFLIKNYKLKIENLPLVLYGGSISSKNLADFLKESAINGVLVGGASVKKEEFVKILQIAASL